MPFCPSCGAMVDDITTFCPECGAEIKKEKVIDTTHLDQEKSYSKPAMARTDPGLEPLYQRNFFIFILLGMVTGGIFTLIYYYLVVRDMNTLDTYPRPANVPSTYLYSEDTILILLIVGTLVGGFSGIVMFVIMYQMHKKLRAYIEAHPQKQQTMPATPGRIIGVLVAQIIVTIILAIAPPLMFTAAAASASLGYTAGGGATIGASSMLVVFVIAIVLTIVLSLVMIGLGIYYLVLQYRWQKAFNERVLIINPQAEEKIF